MALKAAIVPVTPFQQNCTLLFDETTKHGVVVDPGGDLDAIEAAIKQIGMSVDDILLTHGHLDHAGGADELRERLKVKITGPHMADKFLLDGLAAQAKQYGFPGMRNVTPDRWLTEGETVTIAGTAFDVLHCPGHSPGSVVFVNVAAGIALVGDVLFQGSIGRTDFPYGNTDQLVTAVRQKLFPLGDDIVFICGHGPASTFGDERRTNPFVGENA
jgi:hydroxyacylglutathione hydrolase